MSRRRRAEKRRVPPDPKYNSVQLSQFINKVMQNGKKTVAQRLVGATYQVPTEVRPGRRLALSMRWIVSGARARSGRPMADRLAQEILEASRGQGSAAKRKDDLHRMAEANRAFAHYRW